MRPPAQLALILALLPACFADGGSDSVATSITTSSDTGTPGTTTNETTSETTGEPTTQTTTSSPTTTSDPSTTQDPTTTTTGNPGNCQIAPECTPGTVEDGAQCDSCGVLRRTCQADCVWSPQSCELAPETCEYWQLPPGGMEWKRLPVDPNATFAPKDTVLAAIALEPHQQIYVLTATTYHVLSTANNTWTAAGMRDTLFPKISGQMLFHATGLANDPPDVIVSLVAGTEVYAYTYFAQSKTLKLDAQVPCCGDDWMGPNAPPNPLGAVRDTWGRIGDPDGWITGNLQALCNLDEPTPVYGYNIAIGDGFVYPQDIGNCFDFYPPVPYAEFTPFSYPGAPPNNLVGGAAWVDGLYIFRGE